MAHDDMLTVHADILQVTDAAVLIACGGTVHRPKNAHHAANPVAEKLTSGRLARNAAPAHTAMILSTCPLARGACSM